jgi:hypothetical protein
MIAPSFVISGKVQELSPGNWETTLPRECPGVFRRSLGTDRHRDVWESAAIRSWHPPPERLEPQAAERS